MGCEISLRGNELTLDGPSTEVERGEAVVGELLVLLRSGQDIDSSTLEPFGQHLQAFVEKASRDFEIDISEIRYVSSSFIGYLARALVDARARGCGVSIRANDRVAKLLTVAGIDKLAPIVPS